MDTSRRPFSREQGPGGRTLLRLAVLLCLMAWLGISHPARAQTPGTFDPAFNPGGSNLNDNVFTVALQGDGKVLVSGYFTACNGVARNRLARLNADGTLDTTFDPGSGLDSVARAIVVQSDGKILVGGYFATYNGATRHYLVRLNANGSLDTSFNPASTINGDVYSLAIQSDGKIVVGGDFYIYNGVGCNRIARLNTDGTLDATFNPGGQGASGRVFTLAVQTDGRVVIGGEFSSYNGTSRKCLARLNTNGSLDTAYNGGTGPDYSVNSLALLSTGKVVIGGDFYTYNGTARSGLARVNVDGSLDTTFNPGTGVGSGVFCLAALSTGKLFIVGDFSAYNGVTRRRVARINSDGTLDTAFNPGTGLNDSVDYVVTQTDGKPILGGNFTAANDLGRKSLVRFNADGSVDTTFYRNNGVSDYVYRVAAQPDGKVLIVGGFLSVNDVKRRSLARLNADGTLDTTFNAGVGVNGQAYALAVQADGKVLIGGYFSTVNGVARNNVARLNADGSLDTTFNPAAGPNNYVYSFAVQSDGKVFIGGSFSTVNGVSRSSLARLNTDGSLDATFDAGNSGLNDTVNVVVLQDDGKVFIGGTFFTVSNGVRRNNVTRLNADGSVDDTFLPAGGGAYNYLTSLRLQSDGKVVVGGNFPTFNGVARQGIARLNVDGSVDLSFDPGAGVNGLVRSVALQSDGKMVVGGDFTTFNGVVQNYLTRLNADGSLDTIFNPGNTVNKYVYGVALQGDGKVIVGGDFTLVNGVAVARVARLYGGSVAAAPNVSATGADAVQSGNASVRATVNPQASATAASFQYGLTTDYGSNTTAQTVGSGTAPVTVNATLNGLIPGTLYHYRGVATNGVGTTNGPDATFTTLTVAQDWRQQSFGTTANGGVAADSADPDGDGIVNLLERALGLDPKTADTTGLPVATRDAGLGRLTLTASKGVYASDLVSGAEASADLANWTTSGVTILTNTPTAFQARDDDAPAGTTRRFLRLRVSAP